MKIIANYRDKVFDAEGNAIVSFKIENVLHMRFLDDLRHDKNYAIEIMEVKQKRSLQQNKYMWALLHEIDVAVNGARSNSEFDIYIMALERTGAKYEILKVLAEAEKTLKKAFRVVKLIKYDDNNKDYAYFKCFYGSSKMNTKEMNLLIDTVLDIATEAGIETSYYRELLK